MTTPASDSEEIPPGMGGQMSEVDPIPLKAMPLSTPELEAQASRKASSQRQRDPIKLRQNQPDGC